MAAMAKESTMFSGTGNLQMSKSEATLASLSKSEKYSMTQTHPWLPEQAKPGLSRGGWKATYLTKHKTAGIIVSERGAQSQALLTNLDAQIKDLEATITRDEKSLKEMDNNLRVEQVNYTRLQRRIQEEEAVVAAMVPSAGLGSAIKMFDDSMGAVKVTYKHLRGRHADAIGILKKEFNYNPAFKKGDGDRVFSGAYHTMSKDPSKQLKPSNR